ncbi:O-methyltransferase [Colletotrichum graminicola M1.001]|uniref:O-methyltransferase n=1 Tax=Colletotrichum graminicola (strain M1.001 / M2 / FGSC 10212) TaxID=645133 RepID=E3Q581_COLGM|nr:O-methyltransferase [Colletotrichum graminicola M1.001]EFQ25848.1 O-methyltransferase [Colletotrichum graminicola M1.001]
MSNHSDSLCSFASQLSKLADSSCSDDEKNKDAVAIAQNILKAAGGSMPEWMDRMANAMQLIALKLFLDWEVFDIIPMDDSVSYDHLAGHLVADVSLIKRLSWVLISGGILTQVGEDRVAHNEKSKSYLSGTPNELFLRMMYEEHILTALKLPEYFALYGRREPATRIHTPYAFARGKPESEVWEIQRENPEQVKGTMKRMEMLQQFIPLEGIYDFSWVREKVPEDHDRPIFVDVGGSKGHAIRAILKENPFLPADRVILQDRDEVIEQVIALKHPELERVKFQVHDFHTEQPAKNALIYWIRRCLHDFGDDDSVKILSQLSDAMGLDSKVLIVEYVLQSPPSLMGALADFGMMNIGGKERTAENWETLVAHAGLKIEKFHGMDMKMQVIECVKVRI